MLQRTHLDQPPIRGLFRFSFFKHTSDRWTHSLYGSRACSCRLTHETVCVEAPESRCCIMIAVLRHSLLSCIAAQRASSAIDMRPRTGPSSTYMLQNAAQTVYMLAPHELLETIEKIEAKRATTRRPVTNSIIV